MEKTTEQLEEIIYKLFKIIDDIDTIADMAKGNYHNYYTMVNNQQVKRWHVIDDAYVTDLYDKYHNTDDVPKPVDILDNSKDICVRDGCGHERWAHGKDGNCVGCHYEQSMCFVFVEKEKEASE